jgi:hypothetical protein
MWRERQARVLCALACLRRRQLPDHLAYEIVRWLCPRPVDHAQRRGFARGDHPFLCLNSPPGTGKTEAILRRVAAWPQRCFLLTVFNRSIRAAIARKANRAQDRLVAVQTMDSLCFAIRRDGPAPPTEPATDNAEVTLRLQPAYEQQRQAAWPPLDQVVNQTARLVKHGFGAPLADAQLWLLRQCRVGAVWSFDLLRVAACLDGLRELLRDYDEVIVDEAQDMNRLFYSVLLHCHRHDGLRVTLVGDAHQHIYAFAGTVSCFDPPAKQGPITGPDFSTAPPPHRRDVAFQQSYRLSHSIVQHIREYFASRQWTVPAFLGTPEPGLVRRLRASDSASQHFPYLYQLRTWHEVLSAIVTLVPDQVPTFCFAGKSQSQFVRDAADKIAASRELHQAELLQDVTQLAQRCYRSKAAVTFSTVHAAKGLEFRAARVSAEVLRSPERCLQYVALTRASHTLLLNE